MKFTKKTVQIEAVRFAGINSDGDPTFEGDIPDWLVAALAGAEGHKGSIWVTYTAHGKFLSIGTLEGRFDLKVDEKDWIIRGIAGELYPCKPDIFEATYDEVLPAEFDEVDDIERPAPVETFGDVDLLADAGMDGQKWARAFLAMDFSPDDIDEGLMIGWFANAIMAGYDEAQRRYDVSRNPENTPPIAPEIMVMANALIGSKAKFDFYAESHDAKNTPEADVKAEVNREMSAQVEKALTGWMIANNIAEFGGISIDGERLIQNVELDTSDALPIPATDYMQVPADVFGLIYAEAQRSDDPLLPELNAVVKYENKSRGKTFVIGKGFVDNDHE